MLIKYTKNLYSVTMPTIQLLISHFLSRVCAVAQYAVLEANGKVNGIGEISDPVSYTHLTLPTILRV